MVRLLALVLCLCEGWFLSSFCFRTCRDDFKAVSLIRLKAKLWRQNHHHRFCSKNNDPVKPWAKRSTVIASEVVFLVLTYLTLTGWIKFSSHVSHKIIEHIITKLFTMSSIEVRITHPLLQVYSYNIWIYYSRIRKKSQTRDRRYCTTYLQTSTETLVVRKNRMVTTNIFVSDDLGEVVFS